MGAAGVGAGAAVVGVAVAAGAGDAGAGAAAASGAGILSGLFFQLMRHSLRNSDSAHGLSAADTNAYSSMKE